MTAQQSVTIMVRRWFDRRYGNTYFSARALVDGSPVEGIDFAYGYGSHGEEQMHDKLIRDGHIPGEVPNPICASLHIRELGLAYHCETIDVSRKKDL